MGYLERISVWIGGIAGATYSAISGRFGEAFWILLGVMILDLVTGFMKAHHNNNYRSKAISAGIMKKGAIIASVILCYFLDQLMNGGQPAFVVMMTWLSVANEVVSIAENLRAFGVNLPKVITNKMQDVIKEYEMKDDVVIPTQTNKGVSVNGTKNQATPGESQPQEGAE